VRFIGPSFWPLALWLTGKAVACLSPSAMEMGQGNAMDCCADYCRMETTHEAAEKSCDQSRLAFSPHETISSPHNLCDLSITILQPDLSSYPPLLFPLLLRHHQSVQIYTSNKSFLI